MIVKVSSPKAGFDLSSAKKPQFSPEGPGELTFLMECSCAMFTLKTGGIRFGVNRPIHYPEFLYGGPVGAELENNA
jgi:hypothetical protein